MNKTKGNRADGAWTAITIQPEIADLVEKYKAKKGDGLFDFGLDWDDTTSRNYGMAVDRLCKHAELPHYNPYLFRHTVASIARNKFRYSRDDVGMLLNHRGPMTVDDVYIDDDFSINDEINRKILDYVFGDKAKN
jgi:integrase